MEDFIQKKLLKLDKYNDAILDIDVTLKLEKDENLENKVVEVNVGIKAGLLQKHNSRFLI